VDERDPVTGGDVRVGVAVGRTAVGGPPRVPDTEAGVRERVGFEVGDEVGDLAGLLPVRDRPVGHNGHAGGVVAPIFHPPETRDNHVAGDTGARIADNSAHSGHCSGGSDPQWLVVS